MPADDDPYAVLGVAPEISAAELRRAWRRIALRWHPDHAGPEATATFQRMRAAYAVLSDPAARAAHDRDRAPEPPRRRAPGVMLRDLCGPLNALRARGVVRRADDGALELWIDHDDGAAAGGMVTIAMRVAVRCPCDRGEPCPRCGGARQLDELFSAWLAVPPDAADGAVLRPSASLPAMLEPVAFRVRRGGARRW